MPSTYLILLLMLLAMGVLAGCIVVVTLAFALLRPPRMSDGKAVWILKRLSPGDLGLKFEDACFNICDEQTGKPLRITGWWIPNPSAGGRCVVLLHGYADAKVGAIAWAPLWHSLGFNILAIDLRAHGESGGVYFTAGFWERHDVDQVIGQLRAQRPADTTQVVLFGVSIGAAVAAAVADMRDDLTTVVLESPPADFRSAAMAHMDHLGAPGRAFQSLALSLAERIAGSDFSAVRPVDLIKRIPCPVMIIAPDNDPMVNDENRAALEQTLQSRGREREDIFWRVKSGHLLALHAEPEVYKDRVLQFLRAAGSSLSHVVPVDALRH